MKRIIIIFTSLLVGLTFAACSDWLDVRPQSEITKEQLFETQKGFRDALVGAYIRAKGSGAYGDALTWGTIEYMAQHWDLPAIQASSALANLKRYEYGNTYVQGWMEGIYGELYKTIADVNSILERIDGKRDIFEEGNYELIKGEALTLRAFLHFDLLRLFGPIPGTATADPILPYVKTVTNQIHEHLPYSQFTGNILADLNEAEELLKGVDPILSYSVSYLSTVSAEGGFVTTDNRFWGYRQVRANYYAVLAIKARVHLWLQEKPEALRYANLVINALDPDGNPLFRLGTQADMTLEDFAVSPEHVFALDMYDMAARANDRFGQGNTPLQKLDYDYYLGNLFPTTERTTDIRFALWIPNERDASHKLLKKFIQRATRPFLQVPLVRLSEMYLIVTECIADLTDASNVYRQFCTAKGAPFGTFSDEQDRQTRLVREYNREFYAEGQSFFAYKRLNVSSILWAAYPITGSPEVYVVPLPRREIEYNNK